MHTNILKISLDRFWVLTKNNIFWRAMCTAGLPTGIIGGDAAGGTRIQNCIFHLSPCMQSGIRSRRINCMKSLSTDGWTLIARVNPRRECGRYGGAVTRSSKNFSMISKSSGFHGYGCLPSALFIDNEDTLMCNDCIWAWFKYTWHCNESTLNSTTPGSVDGICTI